MACRVLQAHSQGGDLKNWHRFASVGDLVEGEENDLGRAVWLVS